MVNVRSQIEQTRQQYSTARQRLQEQQQEYQRELQKLPNIKRRQEKFTPRKVRTLRKDYKKSLEKEIPRLEKAKKEIKQSEKQFEQKVKTYQARTREQDLFKKALQKAQSVYEKYGFFPTATEYTRQLTPELKKEYDMIAQNQQSMRESLNRKVEELKKSLPQGEKLILDKYGNVEGIESGLLKQSIRLEDYQKQLDKIPNIEEKLYRGVPTQGILGLKPQDKIIPDEYLKPGLEKGRYSREIGSYITSPYGDSSQGTAISTPIPIQTYKQIEDAKKAGSFEETVLNYGKKGVDYITTGLKKYDENVIQPLGETRFGKGLQYVAKPVLKGFEKTGDFIKDYGKKVPIFKDILKAKENVQNLPPSANVLIGAKNRRRFVNAGTLQDMGLVEFGAYIISSESGEEISNVAQKLGADPVYSNIIGQAAGLNVRLAPYYLNPNLFVTEYALKLGEATAGGPFGGAENPITFVQENPLETAFVLGGVISKGVKTLKGVKYDPKYKKYLLDKLDDSKKVELTVEMKKVETTIKQGGLNLRASKLDQQTKNLYLNLGVRDKIKITKNVPTGYLTGKITEAHRTATGNFKIYRGTARIFKDGTYKETIKLGKNLFKYREIAPSGKAVLTIVDKGKVVVKIPYTAKPFSFEGFERLINKAKQQADDLLRQAYNKRVALERQLRVPGKKSSAQKRLINKLKKQADDLTEKALEARESYRNLAKTYNVKTTVAPFDEKVLQTSVKRPETITKVKGDDLVKLRANQVDDFTAGILGTKGRLTTRSFEKTDQKIRKVVQSQDDLIDIARTKPEILLTSSPSRVTKKITPQNIVYGSSDDIAKQTGKANLAVFEKTGKGETLAKQIQPKTERFIRQSGQQKITLTSGDFFSAPVKSVKASAVKGLIKGSNVDDLTKLKQGTYTISKKGDKYVVDKIRRIELFSKGGSVKGKEGILTFSVKPNGNIHLDYVEAAKKGKGVGKKLIKKLEELSSGRNIVLEDATGIPKYYKSLGFKKTSEGIFPEYTKSVPKPEFVRELGDYKNVMLDKTKFGETVFKIPTPETFVSPTKVPEVSSRILRVAKTPRRFSRFFPRAGVIASFFAPTSQPPSPSIQRDREQQRLDSTTDQETAPSFDTVTSLLSAQTSRQAQSVTQIQQPRQRQDLGQDQQSRQDQDTGQKQRQIQRPGFGIGRPRPRPQPRPLPNYSLTPGDPSFELRFRPFPFPRRKRRLSIEEEELLRRQREGRRKAPTGFEVVSNLIGTSFAPRVTGFERRRTR